MEVCEVQIWNSAMPFHNAQRISELLDVNLQHTWGWIFAGILEDRDRISLRLGLTQLTFVLSVKRSLWDSGSTHRYGKLSGLFNQVMCRSLADVPSTGPQQGFSYSKRRHEKRSLYLRGQCTVNSAFLNITDFLWREREGERIWEPKNACDLKTPVLIVTEC